jgi:type II secretory pathway component GspD/PulD (secretin)
MTHENTFAVASKSNAALMVSPYLRIMFVALLIATSGAFLTVAARPQGQTLPQSAAKPAPKKKFRLRITKGYITGVSLKADKAKMSEIAADLSKRLGARVILGPTMSKEAITVEFYDLPLEPALRLLAPHVYLDYEIRANAQPTLLAIFLMGQDDPDPAKNAVVQGSSEAMLIEGNTEDTAEESAVQRDDDPLQVDLDDNHLTIKSKKQPLAAVVMTIAEVLGVPAEIKYDSNEIVDTVIKDTPFEDAIARISPNIRLYVRADLTRSQRTPLRLALVPPAKVADSAMNQ